MIMAEMHPTGALVSVVLPVYNVERYLAESVDSVLGQSYRNLEVILVNDGATDDSPKMCDRYAEQDDRVRVIHQENGGISCARNRGLDAASGEYVYFLDSDDYIVEGAVQKMVDKAESDELDVLLFDRIIVEKNGLPRQKQQLRTREYPGVHRGRVLFADMRENSDFRAHVQMIFMRRGFLLESGVRCIEGALHEDIPFSFLLMMQDGRCGVLPDPLLRKRQRPGSVMTTRQTIENVTGCLRGLEQMIRYWIDHESDAKTDPAVREYILSHFWNTYTRYHSLRQPEQNQHTAIRKRLYDLMATENYLNDRKIARRCRWDSFYALRRRIDDVKRRVLRRMNLVLGQS